jgi:phenylacetate-coenzyme A ligase PaaK-like adenylate-forming protein
MVFPTQVEDIIAATEGAVKEAWHIYIDEDDEAMEQLTVAVERHKSSSISKEDMQYQIGHAIHSRLGIRVTVECHDEGVLPRYEAKAVRVHRRKKAHH